MSYRGKKRNQSTIQVRLTGQLLKLYASIIDLSNLCTKSFAQKKGTESWFHFLIAHCLYPKLNNRKHLLIIV